MAESNLPTRGFWIASVFLVLWNAIGVLAYWTQSHADLKALARTDPYSAYAFATMPTWAWVAYAVAVGAGFLGAVLLLLRRRLAVWLLMLSLLAMIAQFGRALLLTDLIAEKGWTAAIFPIVIVAIGIWAVRWAQGCDRQGLLR